MSPDQGHGRGPRSTANADHDSAGVPWGGRVLAPQPFAGDRGEVDFVLAAALDAFAGPGAAGGDRHALVAVLAPARVFVAVAPAPAELGDSASGLPADVIADIALISLESVDGRRTLPIFSRAHLVAQCFSGDGIGAARPVPVDVARVAQAAVAEGCTRMVLDPSGPVTVVLGRPAIWALGSGRAWQRFAEDPELGSAVRRCVETEPRVRAVRLEAAGGSDADTLVVELALVDGLNQEEIDDLLVHVRAQLADDELVCERVEALRIRLVSAS